MAYKAYNSDLRRVVEVTPEIDVSGRIILAKVFEDGTLCGVANAVKPDMTSVSIDLTINNQTLSAQSLVVTTSGRKIDGGSLEQIDQQTISVFSGTTTHTLSIDHTGYVDLRVSVSRVGEVSVSVEEISVSSGILTDLEGVVVGGIAGEVIAIPCDFTPFVASDNYSLVIEAVGIGLIGKDRLIIFDDDGYTVE